MLKKIFYILILICFSTCSPAIQTSSTTTNALTQHKTIAILPIKIELTSKLRKTNNFNSQEIEELKRYMSLALQGHLYESIIKKQKRFPYTVSIQSADFTNSILSSKKISFSEVFTGDKKELCKILGVDAILSPQAIFGKQQNSSINDLVSPGEMEMTVIIFDSVFTQSVWRFNHTKKYNTKDILTQTQYTAENKYQEVLLPWIRTVDDMFQTFTAGFPYKKK